MGVPLYVTCFFSLAAFDILSLSCIFATLLTPCLGVFLFGLILFGTLCAFWTWMSVSFPSFGKFSAIISSNMFSAPFLSLFSFWDSYNANVSMLDVVSEVSNSPHFFLFFFSFFLFNDLHCSVFQLIDLFLCIISSTVNSF